VAERERFGLAFGPLSVAVEAWDEAAEVATMFPVRPAGGGPAVSLVVRVGPRRPRSWSAENPGGYEVDVRGRVMTMRVADWTAVFRLAERHTEVEFRELWYPGVEQFFKVFVQTWLPLTGVGVAFHAASVWHEGRGLMFPARAETGKTTVARALHEHGATVLSEEMACCEVGGDGGVRLHALPFRERTQLNVREPLTVPLHAVYSLRQGPEDAVHEVAPGRRLLLLARNAAVGFREAATMEAALPLCAAVAARVPVRVLEFRLGDGFLAVV
jgi:hypothetical protein